MHYIYISLFSPDHTPLFTKRLTLEGNNPCFSLTSVQNLMRKNGVYHPEFKSETIQINVSKDDLALRFLDPPSYSWAQIDKINYFVLRDDELVEKTIRKETYEAEEIESETKLFVSNTDVQQYTAKNVDNKINDLHVVSDNLKETFERERDERKEEQKAKEERSEQRRRDLQKKERKNENGYPPMFWIKNTGISWKRGKKGKAWVYPGKAYWECRLVKSIEEDDISQMSLSSGMTRSFEKLEIESC